MLKFSDRDPRFKNLELKIGVMVAAALAGIIFIMILIGIEKDLFIAKYNIYFVSESGAGFVQGMPVKLSGFKIGRVRKLELTNDARVKVTAEINRKYEQWVRDGSKARLAKEGFIGDSFIEITVGKPEGRPIEENGMIPYDKSGGIEELVEKTKPVLNEVKEIIHYANDPEGDVKTAIKNIRELTSELRETRKSFDRVLKDSDRLVVNINEKSSKVMDSAAETMKNVDAMSKRIEPVMTKVERITDRAGEISERLPATAEKMDATIDNLRKITDTLAAETPRLRDILINADDAVRDGKAITKGVKESWPVRLMVPKPKEPGFVPLDGSVMDRK